MPKPPLTDEQIAAVRASAIRLHSHRPEKIAQDCGLPLGVCTAALKRADVLRVINRAHLLVDRDAQVVEQRERDLEEIARVGRDTRYHAMIGRNEAVRRAAWALLTDPDLTHRQQQILHSICCDVAAVDDDRDDPHGLTPRAIDQMRRLYEQFRPQEADDATKGND